MTFNILALIGNTFHTKDIDRAVELGKKYNPNRVIVEVSKGIRLGSGMGFFSFWSLFIAGS